MDQTVKQGVAVTLLIVGPLLIGTVTAEVPDEQQPPSVAIGSVLADEPVGKQVTVVGAVTSTPESYTANSGNTYQRFHVSDGSGEIRVFCSTADGRVQVAVGDRVQVTGTFKEFHGTREITTACATIR